MLVNFFAAKIPPIASNITVLVHETVILILKSQCILEKTVPGQTDIFVAIVPRLSGHFSRCTHGVGAYDGK